MPYISSFIYCDIIRTEMTENGPQPQIIKPLQALALYGIPGNFTFAISFTIAGIDVNKENLLRIQLLSPDEKAVFDTGDFNFRINQIDENEKPNTSMQFNFDLRNLVFQMEGIYSTNIFVDNEIIGTYKIEVIQRRQLS